MKQVRWLRSMAIPTVVVLVAMDVWLIVAAVRADVSKPVLELGAELVTGFLTALATLLIALIAWRQLSSLSQTSRADFLIKLKHEFFTEQGRRLMHLVEKAYLRLIDAADGSESYFEVLQGKVEATALEKSLKARLIEHPAYSSYEVDDWLLGPLEDIALLVSERVLDVHMVNETFGVSVEIVWENPEIQKYVAVSRLDDAKCYDKLESLYHAIRRLSKSG